MTSWRFVWRSFSHYWRVNLAVLLGVTATTAVLGGALIVGDSVRGSLRDLTLARLGKIDEVLVRDHFFRAELAEELGQTKVFQEHYSAAAPALLFPSGSVEHSAEGETRRASQVLVLGSEPAFWELDSSGIRPQSLPGKNEIVLNQPLADELQVSMGDVVTLRLPETSAVPADSALANKSDIVKSLVGLKVVAIVPAEGLGRFSLTPSQTVPKNAYVSLETLQQALEAENKANLIFIAGKNAEEPPSAEISNQLANSLKPRLADLGLQLNRVTQTFSQDGKESPIYDYFQITSDRMILPEAAVDGILAAMQNRHPQQVFTYLANSIDKVGSKEKGIPYSTITAIDSIPALGPLIGDSGKPIPLGPQEIALNSWAADDLKAKPGDKVSVSYFEPETTHGTTKEATETFTLKAIIPLTEPKQGFGRRGRPPQYDSPPTLANDPHFTPEVKGVTDQATIDDWDPPFPFDYSRIRGQDDAYWENHRATPKAFVSFPAGERMWKSRFGNTTSIRFQARETDDQKSLEEQLLKELRPIKSALGLVLQPLKRQGLAASQGATPFDVLFLLLSMFVIVAALMLVALLFRLGLEQRAEQLGLLLSIGYTRGRLAWLLIQEGLLVSIFGGALGTLLGCGYAWLMITGLKTWWIGAVVTPFLKLHIGWLSLLGGFLSGLIMCVLTIAFGCRRAGRGSLRELLGGKITDRGGFAKQGGIRTKVIIGCIFLIALALAAGAPLLQGEAQAGAFVGAGMLLLVAFLWSLRNWLASSGSGKESGESTADPLLTLAWRNAARNPGRSTLTIGLVALASFLIVAMSAFRLAPTARGLGGNNLLAHSDQPIFTDLNSPAGRKDLFAADAEKLAGTTVLSLRLKAGQDASCRNLYQSTQPQVLGVSPGMAAFYDNPSATSFGWAASSQETEAQAANPWRLLATEKPTDSGPVPVILDKNTAMYSLKLYGGVGQEFEITYPGKQKIQFKIVGLLDNTLLQGSLLVGEADFLQLFPEVEGYRYFLLQTPPEKEEEVASLLENRLGDQGFDATDAATTLRELLSVQNTYLSTFQSLGALGLLLGTFGLAAVQMRSVLERRSELALMRAVGFAPLRLGKMVLLENALLLIAGLGVGAISALAAVLPHALIGGNEPPVLELALLLVVVLAIGILSGLSAVRAAVSAPLLAALRGD